MKTFRVKMTEHIMHEWTVEAADYDEALNLALDGCPSDKCQGESDDPTIEEVTL